MTTRSIKTERDRELAVALLTSFKLPATIKLTHGVNRSNEQNNLQWQWANEVAEQLGEDTPAAVQAYFKLHFGVPILRGESEEFRETYDRVMKPQAYEDKLLYMERCGFPVSSLLTTKQMTQYLDAIYTEFTGRGVRLTSPDGDSW